MRQVVISICLLIGSNTFLKAQIYTPSGTIQGSSGSNNVGIGTTSPGYKFEVMGTAAIMPNPWAPGTEAILYFGDSYGYVKNVWGASGEINMYHGITLKNISGTIGRFGNSTSLDSYLNGNVGIGTTTPTHKLHLDGTEYNTTFRISGTLESGVGTFTPSLIMSDNRGTAYSGIRIQALRDVETGGQAIKFSNASSNNDESNGIWNDRMIIDKTGNVGIGTSNPTSITHIVGSTAGDGGTFSGEGSILHITQQSGWSGNQPWALFVEGSSYLSGLRLNGADGCRAVYKTYSGGELGIAVTGDDPITFTQSTSTERMRINSGGYVGIGTANPQNLLDVNGTIHAREFKASLDGWSDYVFAGDYRLMSLKDVENYIKENNKLPEVPSANEVKKEGVNLGEMNALLLKKIEELTLYVIELNRKVEKLESERNK